MPSKEKQERGKGGPPARAMEVWLDDDGTYALEYWDTADEASDEALVRSENVQSEAEVIANVTKWLQGGG